MHDNEEPQNATPEPRGRPSRSTLIKAVATVAVTGLVGGAGWAILANGKPREVLLEPTFSAGTNPFMPPIGQDRSGVTGPPGAGGKQAGDTAGLYGDNGGHPSCDVAGLVTNLQADGIKANAWAQVLHLRPEEIPIFAAGLNPMVLRADTLVTEYGYQDGRFLPYPAALQAGTSVLVNDHGEPTVKCFNGDPLTKGDPDWADFAGPAWPGFNPGAITSIEPSGNAIHQFTTFNMDDGQPGGRTNAGDDPAQRARVLAAINARREATDARQKADAEVKEAANARDEANKKYQAAKDAQGDFEQAQRAERAAASEMQTAWNKAYEARRDANNLRTKANMNPGVQVLENQAEDAERRATDAENDYTAKKTDYDNAQKNVESKRADADAKDREYNAADEDAKRLEGDAKQLGEDAKAKEDLATDLEKQAGLKAPVSKQDGDSQDTPKSTGKPDDAVVPKNSDKSQDAPKDDGKAKDSNKSGDPDKSKNTDGPIGGDGDKGKQQPPDSKPPDHKGNGSGQHGS
ncbi:DUF6777 domain-containing protein [Saccharopolyspora shandongensis]|uniref:DUF6777 domain-containing protein n=1 Tax=Saccharopolyspora shandongensis TaxID=418495 RepID=UPI0033F2BFAE